DLWIQPAAGDAGGAVGAALALWHGGMGKARSVAVAGADGREVQPQEGRIQDTPLQDAMSGSYLGPHFPTSMIQEYLDAQGYPYRRLEPERWAPEIAGLLAEENIVGMFQGRMEFGPRALGNRSILGDARSPKMQSVLNLKIKYRESFRPFAPVCLEEKVSEFFEIDRPSPYMLLVAPVREERRIAKVGDERDLDLKAWVNRPRSDIPAVTHVDYSARIQTVSRTTNPRFHSLLEAFEEQTGYGILINTSFNVRGEPIVCTPEDAYRCFMATEMDILVLEDLLLVKTEQPDWQNRARWQQEFAPD
ncbi:MAG: hypothetical protein KDD47_03965, partial [Acidobacteria bacterium]|nr:hypothetical protein [Acidobacteriota bacterium]